MNSLTMKKTSEDKSPPEKCPPETKNIPPYKSDLEKCPPDIRHEIDRSLSVYDSFRVSSTNYFMREMFFTVALKPGYRVLLRDKMTEYEATIHGALFLFVAKVRQVFSSRPNDDDMSDQEIYDTFEELREAKYLICDEKGLAYLKTQCLDDHLIKQKIANGELTVRDAKIKRALVFNDVNERIKKVAVEARKNLRSEPIRNCLVADVLNIREAEALSELQRNCFELDCVRYALAKKRISKDDVYAFNRDTFEAFSSVRIQAAIKKRQLTEVEVLHYPLQAQFLITNKMILDAVFVGATLDDDPRVKVTKQFVFSLAKHHMFALDHFSIQQLIYFQLITIGQVLLWSPKVVEVLCLPWLELYHNMVNLGEVTLDEVIDKADLLLQINKTYPFEMAQAVREHRVHLKQVLESSEEMLTQLYIGLAQDRGSRFFRDG